MLADFITLNREVIIERASARVALRGFRSYDVRLEDGVPAFLDQLCDALRAARASDQIDHDRIRQSASRHGRELLRLGVTVGQVVQCYGDVCQVVTGLASERSIAIPTNDFQTLNVCIDDAIANAVSEYSRQRERTLTGQGTEKLGALAHELRNVLNAAFLSYEIIKSGQVPIAGSTGLMLGRSLVGLRDLIDRSLAEVRLDVGIDRTESIVVADFLGEVEISAILQAEVRNVRFEVASVGRSVCILGDRQILAAALSNLLQNAFKFTAKKSLVSLNTRIVGGRVLFQVEDECGGLPPGKGEELFRPYEQRGTDRSGMGLGLSIALKAAKASNGTIDVVDRPGKGCVFTLDLPKAPPAPGASAG